MADPYCLHCELGAIVTLRLEDGTVNSKNALGHVIHVAGDLIRSWPAEKQTAELLAALKYLIECSGGTGVAISGIQASPMMRH